MPCYHPMKGWRGRLDGRIVFNKALGYVDKPVEVSCGQCIGCRIERSRQWAVRMMHEAQMHDANGYLTLTYADENLPEYGGLRLEDFQKFMKRYRERIAPTKIKFFHCGEYGENGDRPHYHAIIFGHEFEDKRYFKSIKGHPYYVSGLLSELWPYGHHLIGDVTFGSCQYVAQYVTKKINGKGADDYYSVVDKETGEIHSIPPEYATQSNGIGLSWYKKFRSDVFNGGQSDDVVHDNKARAMKPPRYYLEKLKEEERLEALKVRGRRVQRAKENADDNTPERLEAKEKFVLGRRRYFKNRSL